MSEDLTAVLGGEGAKTTFLAPSKCWDYEPAAKLFYLDIRTDCGGYFGGGRYYFTLPGFREFVGKLSRHQATLEPGTVELKSLEEDFELKLTFEKMGNIEAAVTHVSCGSTYIRQEFKFFSDQSYTGSFLGDLEVMLRQSMDD